MSEHFPAIMVNGARQVGKSTLLKHLLPSADHITFDATVDINNARHDPDLFINGLKLPTILDEIQFAPEVLSSIKRKIDQHKKAGLYFLTGSQNFAVMRHVSESLAGRIAILTLNPLSLSELVGRSYCWVNDFLQDPMTFLTKKSVPLLNDYPSSLLELLWRGMYPGLVTMPGDLIQDSLDSYFKTYVERDVRIISDISNLQEFSRFTALLSNFTGQEINYSQLGRDINITPQTAKRWVDILISSYQWISIPAYSSNTIKRISNKPKGYMSDTGMACYLMHIGSIESLRSHPKLGAIFESFVVQDILKQLVIAEGKPSVYHWRAHSGAEVDLIIEVNNQYFPIEIKYKSHPTKKDARGIQAFKETYPKLNVGPGIIVAPSESIYAVAKDCYVVPVDCS